jgi:hypothetical protein
MKKKLMDAECQMKMKIDRWGRRRRRRYGTCRPKRGEKGTQNEEATE